MSELHLNGVLDLAGVLRLEGKVFANGAEVLVALPEGGALSHAAAPQLVPSPPTPALFPVWATGSANTTVAVGTAAIVVVDASLYMQNGVMNMAGVATSTNKTISIARSAVMVVGDTAEINKIEPPVLFTSSGQP